MRPSRKSPLLPLAVLSVPLSLPLLASCAALIAGAGTAYIVNEEYLSTGVHETQLDLSVEAVWAAAQEGMGILSTAEVESVDFPRQLRGVVRDRDVTVDVQAVDVDQTLLRVQAKKLVGFDEDVARYVTNYIVGRVAPAEE